MRNESTQRIRNVVSGLARKHGIPKMQRMQVELVWVVKDRRKRDADNAVPFLKAIADGLASDAGISAHLVPDDSPEYCVKLMPRIEYRQGSTPHFEVHVTDISNRPDSIGQITTERL